MMLSHLIFPYYLKQCIWFFPYDKKDLLGGAAAEQSCKAKPLKQELNNKQNIGFGSNLLTLPFHFLEVATSK